MRSAGNAQGTPTVEDGPPLAAVKPHRVRNAAVGDNVMRWRLTLESVEYDLGFPIRFVVTISIGMNRS